jgi:hypothetical protein
MSKIEVVPHLIFKIVQIWMFSSLSYQVIDHIVNCCLNTIRLHHDYDLLTLL